MANIPLNIIKFLIVFFAAMSLVNGIIMVVSGVKIALFAVDKTTPNVSVFLGTALIIISAVGIYGALTENHYLLLAYMIIYGTYFLLAFVFGVVLLDSIPSETHVKSEQILRQLYKRQYIDVTVSRRIRAFQRKYRCCGVYNRMEHDVRHKDIPGILVQYCCYFENRISNCTMRTAFRQGCLPVVEKYQNRSAKIAATHLIVTAVFSLLIIVLTGLLLWMVQPEKPPAKPVEEFEEYEEYEET